MRALLHLGTYKTGSSSIQNLLYGQRDRLAGMGVLYPETGLIRSQKIGHRHTGLIFDYLQGKAAVLPGALRDEIAAAGCDTVVFSSEAWSNPRHFSHLSQFHTALRDLGFREISGLLFFRNIVAYHVSHFREYTLNQRNAQPYREYIRKPVGLFDYLMLLRMMRGIFGEALQVVDLASVGDARRPLLAQLGIADPEALLARQERANVKSETALEVEAIRCANALGLGAGAARSTLTHLAAARPDLVGARWTERFAGDIAAATPACEAAFGALSGFDPDQVQALFAVPPPDGNDVARLTPELMALLTAAQA